METKIHTEKFKRNHHWASIIPHWVISFVVDGRRLFFRHSIAVDRRGSHYGDTCESLTLIKNPTEYRRLRKQFVRRSDIDDSVILALKASKTKCLYRGDEKNKWRESRGGLSCYLEY